MDQDVETPPVTPESAASEPDDDEGTGWIWLGLAVLLLALIGAGLYVLMSGTSSADKGGLEIGRPADKPHFDGIVVDARDDVVTMRTFGGESVDLAVTDDHRARIDIQHAQEHSATGQAARAYYDSVEGLEQQFELLFFDDAPVPGQLRPGEPTVRGEVTDVGDDAFSLVDQEGKLHEFRIAEAQRRIVRIEHVELHVESGQPAQVQYEERSGELWATNFLDLPFADWTPGG